MLGNSNQLHGERFISRQEELKIIGRKRKIHKTPLGLQKARKLRVKKYANPVEVYATSNKVNSASTNIARYEQICRYQARNLRLALTVQALQPHKQASDK